MQSWAEQELTTLALGDRRRTQRLAMTLEQLVDHAGLSVPQALGTQSAVKAVYRLWDNEAVRPEPILQAHVVATQTRLAGQPLVLAIQDTTSLDLTSHRSLEGIGPLENAWRKGILIHSVLCCDTKGVPLGVLHQQVWTRDPQALGQRATRHQRATADKESQRWLDALAATEQAVPVEVGIVTISDAESDIFDFLAAPRRPGSELLLRASHNRKVAHAEQHLHQAIAAQPAAGQVTVEVQRARERAPRQAKLSVRYTTLAIQPPQHRQREGLSPVWVQVILASEDQPPPAVEPLRWLLVTTLPVAALAQALECVRLYALRWRIERYHFVLKSGCGVEDLQLETVERFRRAFATFAVVAWRLLWLTYHARQHPTQSCESVLQPIEWQLLFRYTYPNKKLPRKPPSLHEAVRWIAQLGGFLGRKGDGDPGVKTLWLGLKCLDGMLVGHRLAAELRG